MVGIGGGLPSPTVDIRLGDVVVSKPTDSFGEVVQYDFGKALQNGEFKRIGSFKPTPKILLTATSQMKAHHMRQRSQVSDIVAKSSRDAPR